MADSTSNLDLLSASQAQKEVTANALFNAASPAALFARRESTTTALTWGYYGGDILVDGTPTSIANGTVAMTASQTNYVEASRAGAVSKNTTGFTAGSVPLYTVVAGASTVTSYTDHRTGDWPIPGHAAVSMTSDANRTLTAVEARCACLVVTSTVSLTVTRDVTLPLVKGLAYDVINSTTGAQSLQFLAASGTGITVSNAKAARIRCDGTNWIRITADA